MVGRRGARPSARRPPLGDARCHRAPVRVSARVDDRARGLVRDLPRARHHRHPGVARGESNPAGHRAQDGPRRRPGDGRDARSEASARRAGCRRPWLEARRGIGLARHCRQSDQPASGGGAPGDAARGLPGRWPNDRPLAAGTLRSDRGALVPAFHSWHECQSRVRPGPTRQRSAGQAWTLGDRSPSTHEASVGRSPRTPTPPSTRAASAWRPVWPAPPLRNHLASTWRSASRATRWHSPGEYKAGSSWRPSAHREGAIGSGGSARREAEPGGRAPRRRVRHRPGAECPSAPRLVPPSAPERGAAERAADDKEGTVARPLDASFLGRRPCWVGPNEPLMAARRAWFPARATWPPS